MRQEGTLVCSSNGCVGVTPGAAVGVAPQHSAAGHLRGCRGTLILGVILGAAGGCHLRVAMGPEIILQMGSPWGCHGAGATLEVSP